MRAKYVVRGLRRRVTPRRFLGMILLLNIFPIFTLLIGVSQGWPLLDSYLIGFAVDAVLSVILGFLFLTLNLLMD